MGRKAWRDAETAVPSEQGLKFWSSLRIAYALVVKENNQWVSWTCTKLA